MKKNRYFRHDWGARNDPKMLRLVRIKGAVAKAIYWDLIEILYEEGGELPIEFIEDVTFFNHLDDLEIARHIVFESGLFSYNETHFWSERQQRDNMEMNRLSDVRKNAGKAGGLAKTKQIDSKTELNDDKTKSKRQANAKQIDSKIEANNPNKIKYNKIKEPKGSDASISIDTVDINDNTGDSNSDMDKSLPMETEIIPLITPEEFVSMWNRLKGKRSSVLMLNDERKEKAAIRLSEFGTSREAQEKTITELMRKIRESTLIQNEGTWCNFDWIIKNGTNWLKVMEGKYDDPDIRTKVKDIRDIKNVNALWD